MIEANQNEATSRPGRLRASVITLLALGVLAGAGVFIWVSIREDVARVLSAPAESPAPAPAKKKAIVDSPGRPIGEDELAFWSDVAIYKAAPGRPWPIVVVKRGQQPTTRQDGVYQGLLAREVIRQALLLSAREELGALTRDVPIGDSEVAGPPDVIFRIGSRFRTMYQATDADPGVGRVTIVQGKGTGRRVVWSREFDCRMYIAPEFSKLVAVAEEFTRDGFRKTLEDLGLSRVETRKTNQAEGELPLGVEERLGKLAEEDQFAAIRALHATIREKGETSALLIGLSRAYATLGSLSESQWTSDSTAFKARALLYAQRATIRDHDAPASLRGQAYTEVVAGLFRQANFHLDEADTADGGRGALPWVAILRAYSHDDAGALGQIAEARRDDPWPRYFRALAVLRASGHFLPNHDWSCRGDIVGAARALLEKVPDCYRIHDAMTEVEGVGNLHMATTGGLELYPQVIPRRVATVPGLPSGVAGLRDEVVLRNRLVAASADDPSDLSWGVLARQLREVRYLLVCRRIHFLAYNLATDASGFAAKSLPLVADHPNRGYVEGWAESFSSPRSARKLRALDLADIEFKEHAMFGPIRSLDPPLGEELDLVLWEHIDQGTVLGQERRTKSSSPESLKLEARNLLKYDPDSPVGRGALIFSNWEEARPHAAAWEKDHGGRDTFVIAQLGFRFLKEGKIDEAVRRFETALALSPDRWIFDGLAQAYQKSDRMDRWMETIGEYLKREDLHLDHAQVVGDLARYLIEKGRFDKARPFAEISAESGAGWAMLQAAQCAEATGDWNAAERWMSQTTERYANNWMDWFFWCKRTGHGNVRAAADLIEGQIAAGRTPPSDEEVSLSYVLMLDRKPAEARRILERRVARKPDTLEGMFLALACDLAGDAPARDAALRAVADDPKPSAPRTAKQVAVLADWLSKNEKGPVDLQRIDTLLEEIHPTHRPMSCAIVGLFLDRHGKEKESLAYLKRADVSECPGWARLMVRDALRARGVEPAAFPWWNG